MKVKAFGMEFYEIEPSDERLIKVNLMDDGKDVEGIWAYVDEYTKALWDKDYHNDGRLYIASTANSTLHGVPWGAYIPIVLNGGQRPTSDMVTIRKFSTGPIYNKLQYESGVRAVIKSLDDGSTDSLPINDFKKYAHILGDNHELVLSLKKYVTEMK